MDNRIGEMQVFVRVADAGSFSAAARLLRMTPSTVSKLIRRLEQRLGVRLVERSTRRLALTAEGQVYYERSQALLLDLEDIEQQLVVGGAQLGGLVRVTATLSFGARVIEPLLPAFLEAYPNIVVDLSLSDEIVDLYLDRTDVAFRVGQLQDSNLVARRIGRSRRVIVASPAYLARHGAPQTVDDLIDHNCLGFNFRRASPAWPIGSAHGSVQANNCETIGRMVLAGVGLGRLGDYLVRDHLAAGRLVEVLGEADVVDFEEIHALCLGVQRMPQRVRVFLDFMAPRLQAHLAADSLPAST